MFYAREETIRIWRNQMKRFESSSLTIDKWCDQEGIPVTKVLFWRKKLQEIDAHNSSVNHELKKAPCPATISPFVDITTIALAKTIGTASQQSPGEAECPPGCDISQSLEGTHPSTNNDESMVNPIIQFQPEMMIQIHDCRLFIGKEISKNALQTVMEVLRNA